MKKIAFFPVTVKHSLRAILLVLPSITLFLQTGCATMKVTELKAGSADSYAQHEQKGGVAVGIHPMTDKKEIKQTFKVDLLEKGLLPILLVAENQSASSSFILAKEKVLVSSEANIATNTLQHGAITSETPGGAVAIAGASLLAAT